MSAFDHSPAANAAMLAGFAALVNASATNPAYALVYGTTRRATPGAPVGDTPLVTLLFARPACALVDGQLVFAQGEPGDQIMEQGSATWAALYNGTGEWLADMDVTDAAGPGPLRVSGTTGTLLYAGARLVLDSLVMS